MKQHKNNFINATLMAGILAATSAQAVELGNFNGTDVSIKGYIKFDAMVSDYSDGTLAPESIGRDFYVPSLTPVGGESETTAVDFHSRQTRLGLATKTDMDGHTLKSYTEIDFMATAGGDERISNSRVPRLRHAFLSYDNWLFGQTWSTFMNVNSLPETLDFIGNTDGAVFVRQSQIRYTNGPIQIALENPETAVTVYDGTTASRVVTDDNSMPDVVVRYDMKAGDMSLTAAGILRQLAYNNGAGFDETTMAYGVSLSGVYMLGKDDVKVMVNVGDGLGRYVALNAYNDAVINSDGELEGVDAISYSLSYRHWWSEQWRSSVVYSALSVDNDTDYTGMSATSDTSSARVNLLYSPTKALTLGGELAFANREIESGADGSMTRAQFSAKLGF
tara:strand:- start:8894 stop:10066 length:1173 start_codon:yes stop_codon:yes gene_type:complete